MRGPPRSFWAVLLLLSGRWPPAHTQKKVSCALCPEGLSHRDRDGYFSQEGCEQQTVKDLTERCGMCAIWIVAEKQWLSHVRDDNRDNPGFVPYVVPEGKTLAKGCTLGDVPPKRAGTCDYTGSLYKCYCNTDHCNRGTPPCDWLRNSTSPRKDPAGCAEQPKPKKKPSRSTVTCHYCPTRRSYETAKGEESLEGCDEEDMLSGRVKGALCEIQIWARSWTVATRSAGASPVYTERKVEAGSTWSRGVAPKGAKGNRANSCVFTGTHYVCYCNRHLCNRHPPPCDWLREANPNEKQVKGCTEEEPSEDPKEPEDEVAAEEKERSGTSCVSCEGTTKSGPGGSPEACDNDAREKVTVEGGPCLTEIPVEDGTVNPEGAIFKGRSDPQDRGKVGTCEFEGSLYTCYCEGNLCNERRPPCSWLLKANPAAKVILGCTNKDPGDPSPEEDENPEGQEGLTCYHCPAYRSVLDHQGSYSPQGCDHPEVKEGTRKGPLCKVVIRSLEWEHLTKGETPGQMVPVKVPPGRVRRRGSSSKDPAMAGTCEFDGLDYTYYCEEDRCNNKKPPCDCFRKANPAEQHPPGCQDEDPPTDEVAALERERKHDRVTCSYCPSHRSYATLNGHASPEGCEAPDMKDRTIVGKMCDMKIWGRSWSFPVKEGPDPGEGGTVDTSPKHEIITVPEGASYWRGVPPQDTSPSLANTCVFDGILYHCFCDKNLCNNKPPPCGWLKGANAHFDGSQGCSGGGVSAYDEDDTAEPSEDPPTNNCIHCFGSQKGGPFASPVACDSFHGNRPTKTLPGAACITVIPVEPGTDKPGRVNRKGPVPNRKPELLGECEFLGDRYECYCEGDLCNVDPIPCDQLERANPKLEGCKKGEFDEPTSSQPDGEPLVKCGHCGAHQSVLTPTGRYSRLGCGAPEWKDHVLAGRLCRLEIRSPKWRHVTIGEGARDKFIEVSTPPGHTRFKGPSAMDPSMAGKCTWDGIDYTYYCKKDYCNNRRPPCACLREANPSDPDPPGCKEEPIPPPPALPPPEYSVTKRSRMPRPTSRPTERRR